jgi:hypothetical protein
MQLLKSTTIFNIKTCQHSPTHPEVQTLRDLHISAPMNKPQRELCAIQWRMDGVVQV